MKKKMKLNILFNHKRFKDQVIKILRCFKHEGFDIEDGEIIENDQLEFDFELQDSQLPNEQLESNFNQQSQNIDSNIPNMLSNSTDRHWNVTNSETLQKRYAPQHLKRKSNHLSRFG